jgi:hypothetical protein
MGIVFKKVNGDVYKEQYGPIVHLDTFVASGLTAASQQTVPHGLGLGGVGQPPGIRRVWLQCCGNAAAAATSTLDTSQGLADPTGTLPGGKLGFDNTNIYVVTGSSVTTLIIHVMY